MCVIVSQMMIHTQVCTYLPAAAVTSAANWSVRQQYSLHAMCGLLSREQVASMGVFQSRWVRHPSSLCQKRFCSCVYSTSECACCLLLCQPRMHQRLHCMCACRLCHGPHTAQWTWDLSYIVKWDTRRLVQRLVQSWTHITWVLSNLALGLWRIVVLSKVFNKA